MAIYRVQGPDGKVHRFEGPDGASPEEVEGFASQQFGGAESLAPTPAAPKPIGMDAQADFLRAEMQNADPFSRNLAAAGTALSDLWERGKQLVGKGDTQAIEANRIMREEAPIGGVMGQAALAAAPFAMVGNSLKAATTVGAGLGFARPVEGEQTLGNIAKGTAKNVLTSAALAGAGQKIANVAGDWTAKKMADMARDKFANSVRDKTLGDALDAGLVVPPASVNPSFGNVVKESIAGKAATAQLASNRNEATASRLLRRAVGMPDDAPLTSEALQVIRDQAFQRGYVPVRGAGLMPTDGKYIKALDDIVSANQGASRSFPTGETPPIVGALEHLRVRGFDAGDAVDQIKVLRDDASKAYASGDSGMGKALKEAAKALEDQIERNLPQGTGVLESFREARQLMAKTHDVERTIVQGSGTPDIRKLGAMYQKNPNRLTGELRTLGAFANTFPRAAQPARQVAGPGVSALNAFGSMATGGGGAALGGLIGGPMGAAAGAGAAAIPFVARSAARSHLLSGRYQNALRDLYELGLPERTALGLLQNAPVGLTVLGRDPFAQ